MTTASLPNNPSLWQSLLPSRQKLPLLSTCLTLLLLYGACALHFENFFSLNVAANLIADKAFLGIAAIGLTFVILSGGIDLSVGSLVSTTSIFVALAISKPDPETGVTIGWGWSPYLAIPAALSIGILSGVIQGALIHAFSLPPFLVTLGGLFFFRGLALLISQESIYIMHPLYLEKLTLWSVPIGGGASIQVVGVLFLALLVIAAYLAAYRPLGRNIYAIGGNEQSALLMGLPVARTKIFVYAFSGFCAALGGVAHTIYTGSGNALVGNGLELDAIAITVIGGTLLSGGTGGPIGTLLGYLIFSTIQQAMSFHGKLDAAWLRISISALLLAFILLQKLLQPRQSPGASH